MISIESPFLKDINACKLTMRKMGKKINKHSSITRDIKKSKDQNQDILHILKSRNLPNFIIDSLKKRRTFDINFLKSFTISNVATLDEVIKMTCSQENEIEKLFAEHQQRMKKTAKKAQPNQVENKNACFSGFGQSLQLQGGNIGSPDKQDFEIPYEFQENHFESQKELFLGQQFFSMEKQLSSGEQWF